MSEALGSDRTHVRVLRHPDSSVGFQHGLEGEIDVDVSALDFGELRTNPMGRFVQS
jgi:hypothetical protein